MPVSSEQLFAFVKEATKGKVQRNSDGDLEVIERVSLSDKSLAQAISHVVRLSEAERADELQLKNLEMHAKQLSGASLFGGGPVAN